MKIEPQKEYRDRDGRRVNIQGMADVEPLNGEAVYWSLQGDHYTESGMFVFSRVTSREPLTLERYTAPDSWRNLAE